MRRQEETRVDEQSRYLGKRLVLWRYEEKDGAYIDQYGKSHRAAIVQEIVPVVVCEVRTDVRGMFSREPRHLGLRARTADPKADPEHFTWNWTSHADDLIDGGQRWRCETRPMAEFWDAIRTWNRNRGPRGRAFVLPEHPGPIRLNGVSYCPKHRLYAFIAPDDCDECSP